jgi:hypothetical protein
MAGLTGPPGRELAAHETVEGLAVPVLVTCPHGDLAWTAPSAVGAPCSRDQKPTKKATKAEAARAGLSLDFFEAHT